MPVTLSTPAIEKSTYVIDLAFTDEDGASVAITSGTWTLTDSWGNVINNRSGVALPAAATATIVLSGDDLPIPGALRVRKATLKLTLNATYSSSLGSNLNLKDQVVFEVINLIGVS